MTYPNPTIEGFIAEHFVPVKLLLNRPADRPHFRTYHVIWTPTIVIMDRRGAGHYQSLGYLPPELALQMLHIGLARAKLAWSRWDEAAAHLEVVADDRASPLGPEALYWLGIAWYLKSPRRRNLMHAWGRLRAEYPASSWAARVPPNQEDALEP